MAAQPPTPPTSVPALPLSATSERMVSGAMDSPSRIRISELSKKLSGLTTGLEIGREAFRDQVESLIFLLDCKPCSLVHFLAKLKALDERFSRAQMAQETRAQLVREQINRHMEALAAEKNAREVCVQYSLVSAQLVTITYLTDLG